MRTYVNNGGDLLVIALSMILERVMNSSRNGLGMWETQIAREPSRPGIRISMRFSPKFITRSRRVTINFHRYQQRLYRLYLFDKTRAVDLDGGGRGVGRCGLGAGRTRVARWLQAHSDLSVVHPAASLSLRPGAMNR